jgi:hypothetical protein
VPPVGAIPVSARDVAVAVALQRCSAAAPDLFPDLLSDPLNRLSILLRRSILLSSNASLAHACASCGFNVQRPCHGGVSRLTIDWRILGQEAN